MKNFKEDLWRKVEKSLNKIEVVTTNFIIGKISALETEDPQENLDEAVLGGKKKNFGILERKWELLIKDVPHRQDLIDMELSILRFRNTLGFLEEKIQTQVSLKKLYAVFST
jgi:hypothetical protein